MSERKFMGGQNPDRHETILVTREDPTRAWCNVCGGNCKPGAWCNCCLPVLRLKHGDICIEANESRTSLAVTFPVEPREWNRVELAGGARLEVTE